MHPRRTACIEAHKIRKTMLRLGEDWAWSRCMRYGWNFAKGRKALGAFVVLEHAIKALVDDHPVEIPHLSQGGLFVAGAALHQPLPQQDKRRRRGLGALAIMQLVDPADEGDEPVMRLRQGADEIGFVVEDFRNAHARQGSHNVQRIG